MITPPIAMALQTPSKLDISKPGRSAAMLPDQASSLPTTFPPFKTDKPRPHVCLTCTRPFARLEHLKRHERSHTKEKPFACEECARCFARRDLLLRHQQKLHLTVPPLSRGRRRESASSAVTTGTTRVRKNSMASSPPRSGNLMRPRANTISHVDASTAGILNSARCGTKMSMAQATLHEASSMSMPTTRGLAPMPELHTFPPSLPKLHTRNTLSELGGGLRTAPPFGGMSNAYSDSLFATPSGTTVNPAQLHLPTSPQNMLLDNSMSPFDISLSGNFLTELDGEPPFNWLSSFDQHMTLRNESAIDDSSPSAGGSDSPELLHEIIMPDIAQDQYSTSLWQKPFIQRGSFNFDYPADMGPLPVYSDEIFSPSGIEFVPNYLSGSNTFPPPQSNLKDFNTQSLLSTETPSTSAASCASLSRLSPVISNVIETITDTTRLVILKSLDVLQNSNQDGIFRQAPRTATQSPSFRPSNNLSPTADLRRYIAAYIQYFHPHLPFLHIATLSFDSPAFTTPLHLAGGHSAYSQQVMGGGGCLVLIMAAIGALYEFDFHTSKNLFEMSRAMIQLYLQECQQLNATASTQVSRNSSPGSQDTPLWLVQAMLLNVIYGNNCGEKTAVNNANTHCAALVSLARSAGLLTPWSTGEDETGSMQPNHMKLPVLHENGTSWTASSRSTTELDRDWIAWKRAEQRKRTLYAIFILSSLLVSCYNSSPALMNSEIQLELPCDEQVWSAETAEAWNTARNLAGIDKQKVHFAAAFGYLLTASHRQRRSSQPTSARNSCNEDDLQPSTFGCLILINAIHNYIWETRQRHADRHWTAQETEAMHAHIEPALRAWQAAWSSNADHSLERPNPFGSTSLSADCIPLLDLAYVRLFVNLGRSKEAFYRRDWDLMAKELAHGTQIIQHAEVSIPSSPQLVNGIDMNQARKTVAEDFSPSNISFEHLESDPFPLSSSKREIHLRKAASCAANSLVMSDRLHVTFADFSSKELPLQSALCAFDCAQILAEWLSTVQDRVGRFLGILGRDINDFSSQNESLTLWLTPDDLRLLQKVKDITENAATKLSQRETNKTDVGTCMNVLDLENCGYGSGILAVHARMFERQAVWPLCREMAQALRYQALQIKIRAECSVQQFR